MIPRQIEAIEETLVVASAAVADVVSAHGLDSEAVAGPLADLAAVLSVALGYQGDETLPGALSLLAEVSDLMSGKPEAPDVKELAVRIEEFLARAGVREVEEEVEHG